jgi:hypothetical protein
VAKFDCRRTPRRKRFATLPLCASVSSVVNNLNTEDTEAHSERFLIPAFGAAEAP